MQTSAEAELLAFFTRVANKDKGQLDKLCAEKEFRVDSEHWSFTLPSLHAFLKRQQGFPDLDYKQFRKLIFSIPINRTIKAYGAAIDIVDNQSRVDHSRYALFWSGQQDDGA